MSNKITYRQQFTRCGKQRCRTCREGIGHGPYWYAYWSEKGRTRSKYIGIHRPDLLDQAPCGIPGLFRSEKNENLLHQSFVTDVTHGFESRMPAPAAVKAVHSLKHD